MGITKTIDTDLQANPTIHSYASLGGMFEVGTITMGTTYPIGGEDITFPPWRQKPRFLEIEAEGGYEFQYDRANNKIKAFTGGKSLIVEEVVVVASHTGTLAHKPFYILAIDVTATTTTGPYHVIPVGKTPLTLECAVNFATGGLTFVAADLVTAVRVTYIPLHETGPFSSDNLVIDESMVASDTPKDLANQAAAVQYIYDVTGGNRMALEPVDEEPSATKFAVVDIDDGSDDTNIDVHNDDDTNVLSITYIKYGTFAPAFQLGDGDLTLDSAGGIETYYFVTHEYNYLAIPGLGTQCVGEATATDLEFAWSGPSITAGAGAPTIDFEFNKWATNEGTAVTTLAVPIIFLNALSLQNAKLEVATGEDLSGLTIRYVAFGF